MQCSRVKARTAQVIVPEKGHGVVVVALAGDGQRAEPRSWRVFSGHLEGHCDVFCLFGLNGGVEAFHNKARVVHLEGEGNRFKRWTVIPSMTLATSQMEYGRNLFWLFPYLERVSGGLQEDVLEGDIEAAARLDGERALRLRRNADAAQDKGVLAAAVRGQGEQAFGFSQPMRLKAHRDAGLERLPVPRGGRDGLLHREVWRIGLQGRKFRR